MGARRLLGISVVLGLALACGKKDDDGADGGAPGRDAGPNAEPNGAPVEIGTGADGFYPVTDGQTLQIVAGPQGGYHVWAALRARAPINPKNLTMNFRLLRNGTEVSNNTWKYSLTQNGSAWEWYAGTEIVSDPGAVAGQEVEYRVDVTDTEGRTGSDSRRVILRHP